MEELKWQFKAFGHYFQMTMNNNFIILGKRQGQWKQTLKL